MGFFWDVFFQKLQKKFNFTRKKKFTQKFPKFFVKKWKKLLGEKISNLGFLEFNFNIPWV